MVLERTDWSKRSNVHHSFYVADSSVPGTLSSRCYFTVFSGGARALMG